MNETSNKKAFEPPVLETVAFFGDVITASTWSGGDDNGDSPFEGEPLPIDIYAARRVKDS